MNKNLDEFLSKVLDGRNPDWIRHNEMDGVDYEWHFNPKDLGLPDDKDELELFFDDKDDYNYKYEKDGYHQHYLFISTCEDIFINYENRIIFPSGYTVNLPCKNWKKMNDDLQAFIMYELFHIKTGMGAGIYRTNYHDNECTPVDFSEERKGFFVDNEEKFKKQLELLDEVYDLKERLNDNTVWLNELPESIWNDLPDALTTCDIEVYSFEDISPLKIEIESMVDEHSFKKCIEPHLDSLKNIITQVGTKDKWENIPLTLNFNLVSNTEQFLMEEE
jgi:hypothetical protein